MKKEMRLKSGFNDEFTTQMAGQSKDTMAKRTILVARNCTGEEI